jgi:hypothetical protein
MKYSKTFGNSYIFASLIGMVAFQFAKQPDTNLNQSLLRINRDYTKVNFFEPYKLAYKKALPAALAFAGFATVFRYIGDTLV